MGDCIWKGDDVGNEGNWGIAANWVGGVPVNGSEIFFRNSSQSVTGGLNQSTVHPGSMQTARTYTGSIGSSGSPLKLDYIADQLFYEGQGSEAWFEFVNATTETPVKVADTGPGANALHLDAAAGGITPEFLKGVITIDTGATVKTMRIGYVTSPASDVGLTIKGSVTLGPIYQHGGEVTSESGGSALTLYMTAGGFTITGTDKIAYAYIYGGASITYNATGDPNLIEVVNGTFKASGSIGPITILDATVYANGIFNIANGQYNIDVTNGIKMLGEGKLIVDKGRQLTPKVI